MAHTVITLGTLDAQGPLPLPCFGISNAANKRQLTDSFSQMLQHSARVKHATLRDQSIVRRIT